jgi:hypothetical protein
MDSIFEEDADAVGGEIEAYCPSPRCKADTTHTIISMYEDEVRRVQCVVCGEVHAYRKPRGDGADGDGEGGGKKHGPKRLSWDEAMARASDNDLANCRPYSIRDTYEDGDVVHHPVFDVGFVVEQLPDNKVEVIFRDGGARILVHNRGDLASRMPEISEIPAPREQKKKRRAKKPENPQPVPARSKAEVEAAVVRARTAAQARMEEAARTADERSKKLKATAKPAKGKVAVAKPAPAKGGKPAKAAKPAKPAKAAKPAKPAKPAKAAKPAKPAKAAKPAKKTAKPAKKTAKPAKKPAKPASAKKGGAKKPAKKKR